MSILSHRAIVPIPLAEFRGIIGRLYAEPMRSPQTRTRALRVLGLVEQLGAATTADLTPDLVAAFLAARPAGEHANTTHSLLAVLRAMCNLAADLGHLAFSPFAIRKRWIRKVPATPPRVPSRAEVARVLALLAAEAEARRGWSQWRARRLHALTATLAFTGLRRNEALHLQLEDVGLVDGLIRVRPRIGRRLKTEAAAAPVPIAPPLAPILAGWLAVRLDVPGLAGAVPDEVAARPRRADCPWLFPNLLRTGPWTGGTASARPAGRIKAAGLRAGVPDLTPQCFRHALATHGEHWGISAEMLRRILRHTSLATQEHYRHPDLVNLRLAAARIDFGAAGP